MKNKIGFNFFDIYVYLFCTLFALICFYPLWYVFIGSITLSQSYALHSLRFLPPRNPTLSYYAAVIFTPLFLNSFSISFFKTAVGACGSLIVTGMLAYGVSKKHITGMKTINFMIIFFMFFGGGLIPTYLLYINLRLIGTFWVMVLPSFVSIGHFIIMRNYFSYNVESELEDAALMDGANNIVIFFKIIIPVSRPMLAAIFLFEAVGHWNDWVSYLYFVRRTSLMPFIVVLQEVIRNPISYVNMQGSTIDVGEIPRVVPPASLVNTTIIIAMLPIMMLYPFLQKHFAKGIMIGAVKG